MPWKSKKKLTNKQDVHNYAWNPTNYQHYPTYGCHESNPLKHSITNNDLPIQINKKCKSAIKRKYSYVVICIYTQCINTKWNQFKHRRSFYKFNKNHHRPVLVQNHDQGGQAPKNPWGDIMFLASKHKMLRHAQNVKTSHWYTHKTSFVHISNVIRPHVKYHSSTYQIAFVRMSNVIRPHAKDHSSTHQMSLVWRYHTSMVK